MRKKILSLGVLMASMSALADNTASPYTGSTVGTGTYYLYNVASGLWLQNNNSRANLWQPHANLGTRGIDFTLEASGNGYKMKGNFGSGNNTSMNPAAQWLDNNDNCEWVIEPTDLIAGISNGYTLGGHSNYTRDSFTAGMHYLRAACWNFPNKMNNLFYSYVDGDSWTLEDQYWTVVHDKKPRSVWQLVSRDERISVMQANASADTPQDASWLIPDADFAWNNNRESKWAQLDFVKEGQEDGNWRRGNSIRSLTDIDNGKGLKVVLTNIPNGLYRFNLQGFYRDGSAQTVVDHRNAGTEQVRVYYYANDVRHPLMSILDEPQCTGTAAEGPRSVAYGGYIMPNKGAEASELIGDRCAFVNEEIEVMVNDGTLTLGVVKEGDKVMEWCVVDNFHLTYLGTKKQYIDENKVCRTVPAADVTVTLARQLSADNWNTFCVPFAMDETQVTAAFGSDTKITKLKSVEGDVMYFEDATTIEAGMPCLIKPATTTPATITLSGITMTDTEAQSVGNGDYKFTGTYSTVDLKTDGTNLFLQTNGNLASPADATKTLKGMRAYFEVPAGAAARIVFDDGTTTGIDLAAPSTRTAEASYTLDGRKTGNAKGIVVSQGKKYIRK